MLRFRVGPFRGEVLPREGRRGQSPFVPLSASVRVCPRPSASVRLSVSVRVRPSVRGSAEGGQLRLGLHEIGGRCLTLSAKSRCATSPRIAPRRSREAPRTTHVVPLIPFGPFVPRVLRHDPRRPDDGQRVGLGRGRGREGRNGMGGAMKKDI